MFEVGQRVKVIAVVHDEQGMIAPEILRRIGEIGEVTDDFGGTAISVKFADGNEHWFYRDELEPAE